VIEGSRNVAELRRRMDGFMRRVKKAHVLKDLPPIRWDVIPVAPKSDSLTLLPSAPPGFSDDELLKWLSGAGGEHVMRLRRLLGIAKTDAAIEYLDDFLANAAPDQKILAFAHHKEVIEALVAGLGSHNPVKITGADTPLDRTKAINSFLTNDRCRVFIGNIAAAGTAITLVGPKCKCSDVFFVEASYSVGDNVQAACRVHRIGQHDGVVARFLTAHGTIDDRIQDILARKASDFDQLFN
jgi:SNF2 family DNA or RNA helicase